MFAVPQLASTLLAGSLLGAGSALTGLFGYEGPKFEPIPPARKALIEARFAHMNSKDMPVHMQAAHATAEFPEIRSLVKEGARHFAAGHARRFLRKSMGFDPENSTLASVERVAHKLERKLARTPTPEAVQPLLKRLHSSVQKAIASVPTVQGPKEPPIARPRTGNPYQDGLVGVEPNPGPNKVAAGKKTKKAAKAGANTTGAPQRIVVGPQAGVAASRSSGVRALSFGAGRRAHVLGSECTVFHGRTLLQTVGYYGSGTDHYPRLVDAAGLGADYIKVNPRLMCQNSNFNVPVQNNPLTRVACAFRKFVFLRLKFEYIPLSATTANPFAIAFAFVPDASVRPYGPSLQTINLAMYDSSSYGAYWQPHCVDATPVLDKSRWYNCEFQELGTEANGETTLQGYFAINAADKVASGGNITSVGLIVADYELALCDLGPTDIGGTPSLSRAALSKDEEALIEALRRNEVAPARALSLLSVPPTPVGSVDPGSGGASSYVSIGKLFK